MGHQEPTSGTFATSVNMCTPVFISNLSTCRLDTVKLRVVVQKVNRGSHSLHASVLFFISLKMRWNAMYIDKNVSLGFKYGRTLVLEFLIDRWPILRDLSTANGVPRACEWPETRWPMLVMSCTHILHLRATRQQTLQMCLPPPAIGTDR